MKKTIVIIIIFISFFLHPISYLSFYATATIQTTNNAESGHHIDILGLLEKQTDSSLKENAIPRTSITQYQSIILELRAQLVGIEEFFQKECKIEIEMRCWDEKLFGVVSAKTCIEELNKTMECPNIRTMYQDQKQEYEAKAIKDLTQLQEEIAQYMLNYGYTLTDNIQEAMQFVQANNYELPEDFYDNIDPIKAEAYLKDNPYIDSFTEGKALYTAGRFSEALPLLMRASMPDNPKQGNPNAQLILAKVFEIQELNDDAIYWYRQAAYNEGLSFLLLDDGVLIESTSPVFREGHPEAQYTLCMMLDNGADLVEVNKTEALYWCERAVNQGYTPAEGRLQSIKSKMSIETMQIDSQMR